MHQYLFFIGDFPIRAYGAMLALAIICGASVAYVLLKKDGRGWHEHIIDFFHYCCRSRSHWRQIMGCIFFDCTTMAIIY